MLGSGFREHIQREGSRGRKIKPGHPSLAKIKTLDGNVRGFFVFALAQAYFRRECCPDAPLALAEIIEDSARGKAIKLLPIPPVWAIVFPLGQLITNIFGYIMRRRECGSG